MSDKRTAGTRAQRGRAPQARRSNSMGLLYAILAVIVIAGIALVGVASLSGRSGTGTNTNAQSNGIVSSIPLDSLPSQGSAGAPVTVIEYGDYQCPACGYFATQLEPAFAKQYIDTGKVRLIFHDFPLSQHRNAVPAGEAARAAGEQGKYWEMHDLLYAKQSEWSDVAPAQAQALFIGYAQQLQLDQAKFEQALTSGKYRADVQKAGQAASAAGINETPTFVINGKPYNYSQLPSAVEAALAGKK